MNTHDIRQAHHRWVTEHHGFCFQSTDTHRNHAQRIHVRGMAVCAHASIGVGDAILYLNNRRHFFQIDLVHDTVACWNHIDVFKGSLCPVDKVKTVFVAAVFDGAVFFKRIWVITTTFHSKRVVNNQLGLYHRVDLAWVAALLGDGVTQACQVHKGSLTQNVVTHHTRRVPRKV